MLPILDMITVYIMSTQSKLTDLSLVKQLESLKVEYASKRADTEPNMSLELKTNISIIFNLTFKHKN